MGRDHSYECEKCHCMRGGFDGIPCLCDLDKYDRLDTLAHNLAIGAALCRAFELGRDLQHALTVADESAFRSECEHDRKQAMRDYFHPGCGRSAT